MKGTCSQARAAHYKMRPNPNISPHHTFDVRQSLISPDLSQRVHGRLHQLIPVPLERLQRAPQPVAILTRAPAAPAMRVPVHQRPPHTHDAAAVKELELTNTKHVSAVHTRIYNNNNRAGDVKTTAGTTVIPRPIAWTEYL